MKSVLITGGSRGIGAAAVELFAKNGYRVGFSYLNSKKQADALCEKTGAVAFCADVKISSEAYRVVREFGTVDVLINNAAIAQEKLFCDITDDDFKNMFDVNVGGVFFFCRAVLPQMISRKNGVILNVSSICGISGCSCEVHYSAAKAAVIGLTKALAKETALSGVRVNCVAPGVIDTDMLGAHTAAEKKAWGRRIPLGRLGTPHDIAQALLFLASDVGAGFITGEVLSPNGGLMTL